MGLITVSNIPDGTTIDSRDVNDPINTIVNEFNGNIESPNIKDSAITESKIIDNAVTTNKIKDANVTIAKLESIIGNFGAWIDWTPTFVLTGAASQTCTATGAYMMIGKTCHFWAKMLVIAGSNFTGLTSMKITLPFTGVLNQRPIGTICCVDAGGAGTFFGVCWMGSTTLANLWCSVSSSTYVYASDITSAVPFSWGVTDYLAVRGTYEVA